ncbi:MAG TPA: hypothetical protein VHW23_20055 [Kofleriaceae bacterium]|jgi:hypothetical protein|nr:hypothetical protein [Kofleriaceae bacterium]
MMNVTRACLIGGVIGSFAAPAEADDAGDASRAPDGQYAVMRGVQGPAGMVAARILLDINLSADQAGKPISLAPDLYYSATDRLQLGIVHDGPMGWQARPGLGLCLTGTDSGCPHVYDNVGLDVMYGVSFGQYRLSTHSSLFVSHFDPLTMSLALGATAKTMLSRKVALLLDPKIAIAVTERDTNDDALYIPAELQFQLGASTTLKLLTGLSGGLSTFGDSYEIPVGVGLLQNLTTHFDIAVRLSFDNLLGHEEMGVGRADIRSLALLVNIRS